jgi:hypothetical protein
MFLNLEQTFSSRAISKAVKTYKTTVKPILVCGGETWPIIDMD